MNDLVERIRSLATAHGLSGQKLGTLLGLKKSPLTDWKNEQASPTLDQVMQMCEIFGVTTDYLIKGVEKLAAHEQQPVDQEVAELWEEFEDMSLDETIKTLEYVRLLKLKRMI